MIRLLLSSCACAAALMSAMSLSSHAAEGKTYLIQVNRPAKAGDRTHVELKASVEQSQKFTQGDKTVKETSSEQQVEISGIEEVLEVNERGEVKKASFKVEKFAIKGDGNPVAEPLKTGAVIIGTTLSEHQDRFEVDGQEADPRVAQVLNSVMRLTNVSTKPVDDDAILQTKMPRAVGSEWDADSKILAASWPDDIPFVVDEGSFTEKVRFPAIKMMDGVECCQLQTNLVIKPKSMKGIPPTAKMESMSMRITDDQMVPVDTRLPIASSKTEMQMEVRGTVISPAGEVKLVSIEHRTKEVATRTAK